MKKFKISSFIVKGKFKYHKKIKNKILNFLNLRGSNYYYKNNMDNITKVDFHESTDFNRDWVVLIKDKLQEHFKKCSNYLGYTNVLIRNIWFQQYKKESTHHWHIHGANYTGVYYIDFKKNYSKTQIIESNKKDNIYEINVNEGDIIIFPSYIIHRSPPQRSKGIKTIISFNLDFEMISLKKLTNINSITKKKILF